VGLGPGGLEILNQVTMVLLASEGGSNALISGLFLMARCVLATILLIILPGEVVADVDGLAELIQVELFDAAYFLASEVPESMVTYPLLRFVSLSW
jgi:hypothetical protein